MADLGSAFRDPQVGVPRSGGVRFGELPSAGAALARLGRALENIAQQQAELDERKQDAADANVAFRVLNDTELGIAESLGALDTEGPDHAIYRARGLELVKEHTARAEEQVAGLKTERVREYALRRLGDLATRHALRVFEVADKKFLDEDRAKTAAERQRLVDLAINAADDVSFAEYRQRLTDFIGSKAGNTLSRVEAERILAHDLQVISEERLKAQIRRAPDAVEEFLGGAAGRALAEHEKDRIREYAAAVQRARAEEQARLDRAAAAVFRAEAERIEIELYERARKRLITKDEVAEIARRFRGPMGEPALTAERVAAIQRVLDDPAGEQSVPAVMQQLILGVNTATTTAQYRVMESRLDDAFVRGLITAKDYDHLRTRNRQYLREHEDRVKSSYRETHEQVAGEMRALFRIDTLLPGPFFDERAQAYERALRELNKASVYRGGTRDPREWWEENRIRIAGQVFDILDKQILLIRQQLPAEVQRVWDRKADPDIAAAQAAQELERMRPRLTREAYGRLRDNILELREMEREMRRSGQPVSPGTINPRGRQ